MLRREEVETLLLPDSHVAHVFQDTFNTQWRQPETPLPKFW